MTEPAVDLSAYRDVFASVAPAPTQDRIPIPPSLLDYQPCCPSCLTFLYPIRMNEHGDVLFECLNDGYEAVHRAASQEWESRPGRAVRRWTVPLPFADAKHRLPEKTEART